MTKIVLDKLYNYFTIDGEMTSYNDSANDPKVKEIINILTQAVDTLNKIDPTLTIRMVRQHRDAYTGYYITMYDAKRENVLDFKSEEVQDD